MRVPDPLGLRLLRKEWERIYDHRSGIFHGTLKLRNDEITQLALDATTLCGRIVLAYAQRKVCGLRASPIPLSHRHEAQRRAIRNGARADPGLTARGQLSTQPGRSRLHCRTPGIDPSGHSHQTSAPRNP